MSVEGKVNVANSFHGSRHIGTSEEEEEEVRSIDRCSGLLPVFPIVTVTENTLCGVKTIIITLLCPNAQPHISTMGL